MPRDSDKMPICSPNKHDCIEDAIRLVEQNASNPKSKSLTIQKC